MKINRGGLDSVGQVALTVKKKANAHRNDFKVLILWFLLKKHYCAYNFAPNPDLVC